MSAPTEARIVDLVCDHCGVVLGPYRDDDADRAEAAELRHLDWVAAYGEDPAEHTFTEHVLP